MNGCGSSPRTVAHVVCSVGPRSTGPGGVAANLARYQRCSAWSSQIWCLDDNRAAGWARELYCMPSGMLQQFAALGPARWAFSPMLEWAARSSAGSHVEVFHQHGVWMGFSHATLTWQNKNKGPTVISAHGSLDAWPLRRSNWKKQIALVAYERKNLRRASCLHALSAREYCNYRDFGLRNPVAVIPNGISEEWIEAAADPEAFKNRIGIPRDSRVMLFLSRITPKKGLPMFIEAAANLRAELRDWTVIIAGMDEFDHEREVRSIVERLGLADRFVFAGPLFGQDKRNAYAAADLFVLPSHSEGAPVVVLEALGAGVPVLTTTASPWEEIQSSGCGWRVDPSVDSIGAALAEALRRTRAELVRLGEAGRKLARERYTWQAIAPRTLELYDWLLGKAPVPQFVHEG